MSLYRLYLRTSGWPVGCPGGGGGPGAGGRRPGGAGMAEGFQVTMSDLQAAAQEFESQAVTFSRAMTGNGPAPVDGGSWVINDALSTALGLVGLLHTQL